MESYLGQFSVEPTLLQAKCCHPGHSVSFQDENDIAPIVDAPTPLSFSENLTSEGLPFDQERNMYELFKVSAVDGDISEDFGNDSIE